MTEEFSWNIEGNDFPRFEISNRDQALFLMQERDLEAQLLAIRGVLRRNQKADQAVSEQIRELDKYIRSYTGDDERYQMYIEDQWVDAMHHSVFQDAANSMAAVGMLAPFIESLFVSIFSNLSQHLRENGQSWRNDSRLDFSRDDFWDPHWISLGRQRRKNIPRGIIRLCEATGLAAFLPAELSRTLSALFAYRNKMFHHGFEWPMDKRREFADAIVREGWSTEWFEKSTSGDRPWIFYMSAAFIAHCLSTIDQVIDGVGKYLKQGE